MKRCLRVASRVKRFFLPSPAKEKPLTWDNPVGRFDLENPEFARDDDETFFDPKACLDSDCEDDFFSVNGDFTPTRGSTPDHQIHTPSLPVSNGPPFLDKYPDSNSEASPTSRKKLGDLLRETSQGKQVVDSPNVAGEKVEIKMDQSPGMLSATPNYTVDSSGCRGGEVTPSRDRRRRKCRAWKSGHCCLPSLQSFGFDEKKEKTSPPGLTVVYDGPCASSY